MIGVIIYGEYSIFFRKKEVFMKGQRTIRRRDSLLQILTFSLFVLCLICAPSMSQAYSPAPPHYHGNHRYPLIWTDGRGDLSVYLDKNSLQCEEYNPPFYELSSIAALWVRDPNTSNAHVEGSPERYYFKYNLRNRRMYFYNYDNHEWKYLNPDEEGPDAGDPIIYIGDAAFYLDYGIEFYSVQERDDQGRTFYQQLDD